MAVLRRKPANPVTVHSDQGSQYTSHDWQTFLKDNQLQASMSRRGNCHDNAVAESFFQLLKRERIKRHIYSARDDTRGDVSGKDVKKKLKTSIIGDDLIVARFLSVIHSITQRITIVK